MKWADFFGNAFRAYAQQARPWPSESLIEIDKSFYRIVHCFMALAGNEHFLGPLLGYEPMNERSYEARLSSPWRPLLKRYRTVAGDMPKGGPLPFIEII